MLYENHQQIHNGLIKLIIEDTYLLNSVYHNKENILLEKTKKCFAEQIKIKSILW